MKFMSIICYNFSKTIGEIVCSSPDKKSTLSAATSPSFIAKAKAICLLCCGYSGYGIKQIWSTKFFSFGGRYLLCCFETSARQIQSLTDYWLQLFENFCVLKLCLCVACKENGEQLGVLFIFPSCQLANFVSVTI